ncbi:MAG: Gamma-glutamyl phosphate reductase [Candidatus Moanabacter tarae]|uniref:Gamma-glutamyl phosphate reductase n=1 Tax=Candidatus Moanibacter tarae TaxID=2200854 RepID=A0A2Z4AN27_9BACT|nr:MAG: Gamma-glutamyl phosphate reductase [Candidatus Moanabacter tarae]|tara:strand:+ start:30958 stop:32259 length:1302 start_codon:yes stop_codon:yes gene_type:complete
MTSAEITIAGHTAMEEEMRIMARSAQMASLELATTPTKNKNAVLTTLADFLHASTDSLLAENSKDLEAGVEAGLSESLLERLTLSPERIEAMAEGVLKVARLQDPVGEELERSRRPNGLEIRKVRVPIGVIGIIYESRPNVTIDCAALCLKSGNASILRGGKEAFHTNGALASLIKKALFKHEVDQSCVQFVATTDRKALNTLLKCDDTVDCIIPRGGESLIRFVTENSLIPVIKHYKGVCCVYVDQEADIELAQKIVVNAKVQRPGVCNAAENLFIHEETAHVMLPKIAGALAQANVELRLDKPAREILHGIEGLRWQPASEEDFYTEYLSMTLAVKIVPTLQAAIEAVNRYGSSHSDAIVTQNEESAKKFLTGVDSATVYWNASTRFTDGFEFGLGAEIGISTDKLHARGPMGLRELTTYKYMIFGSGQLK